MSGWEKFWRWYDRVARLDFAGNLLSAVFDWKTWIWGLVPGGGAVTFFWAAVANRSALDVWVLTFIVMASIAAAIHYGLLVIDRFRGAKAEAPIHSLPAEKSDFPNLEDYFATDFKQLSVFRDLSMHIAMPDGAETDINVRVGIFRDSDSNVEFVSAFIPVITDARFRDVAASLIVQLKEDIKNAREWAKLISTADKWPGSDLRRSEDLVFSGRVFVYTLNLLDTVQTGKLIEFYRQNGLFLEIRGADYLHHRLQQQH
jgi:hypothetical protein